LVIFLFMHLEDDDEPSLSLVSHHLHFV
jgi:hypothetical protein